VDYLETVGMDAIAAYEHEITEYARTPRRSPRDKALWSLGR